jgi:hypothetical protein
MLSLRKSVLSSISGQGDSRSSETEHDIRTAPRPKFFVSNTRLQKKTPQSREKLSWFRVLTRIVSVARILSTIEERRQGKIFLSQRRHYRKGSKTRKMSWVRVFGRSKDVGFRDNYFLWYSTIRIEAVRQNGLVKNVSICRISPQQHYGLSSIDYTFKPTNKFMVWQLMKNIFSAIFLVLQIAIRYRSMNMGKILKWKSCALGTPAQTKDSRWVRHVPWKQNQPATSPWRYGPEDTKTSTSDYISVRFCLCTPQLRKVIHVWEINIYVFPQKRNKFYIYIKTCQKYNLIYSFFSPPNDVLNDHRNRRTVEARNIYIIYI